MRSLSTAGGPSRKCRLLTLWYNNWIKESGDVRQFLCATNRNFKVRMPTLLLFSIHQSRHRLLAFSVLESGQISPRRCTHRLHDITHRNTSNGSTVLVNALPHAQNLSLLLVTEKELISASYFRYPKSEKYGPTTPNTDTKEQVNFNHCCKVKMQWHTDWCKHLSLQNKW